MKTTSKALTFLLLFATALASMLFDAVEAEARRGGGRSFGGSRRSPSYSPNRSASRPSVSRTPSTATSTARQSTSFGGKRLSSAQEYTRSYGVPRRTERVTAAGPNGTPMNYNVNRYGGMGDGFMMGYMMGHTPFLWSTPFHPAFYYSRPSYVQNANGTVDVYPPTFSWGKMILTVVVVGGIAYVIYRVIRRRRAGSPEPEAQSSFS